MARLGVFNARDQKGHEGSIVTEIKNEEVIFTTTSFTGRGCCFSWGFSDVHIHLQTAQFQKGRDEYLPIPLNQINYSKGLYKQNTGW